MVVSTSFVVDHRMRYEESIVANDNAPTFQRCVVSYCEKLSTA